MTPKAIKKLALFYEDELLNQRPHQCGGRTCVQCKVAAMVPQIVAFVDEGRTEKAHRWLGFIQGILSPWSSFPVYTLNQLKDHSRKASEENP